jgi:hypothetical protein
MGGVPAAQIGTVTDDATLKVRGIGGRPVLSEPVSDLKEAWQAPLRW